MNDGRPILTLEPTTTTLRRVVLVIAALVASGLAARAEIFAEKIQPLLQEHCFKCHSHAGKISGGLVLDSRAAMLTGGNHGAAIRPGKPGESLLIKAVRSGDPDLQMPPKGQKLSDGEIAALSEWIQHGAIWPAQRAATPTKLRGKTAGPDRLWWAFQPVRAPNIPVVRDGDWSRNPIDKFIFARLKKENIKPAPEAEREVLIRRLCLDLVGLPPSPEEVAAFVYDRRPDAYEVLVNRLLASPYFGERWGRHWLDLARYADSDGYQLDYVRPWAYVYRDWVIAAYNRDLPYDRFTLEQLAGDLLPNATVEQRIATGFHRQTLVNNESGVDLEEFRCKAKVDRVATTGTVWLGLTVGCAECHSHKYDPISQREFYELYAFFNHAEEELFNVSTTVQAYGFREASAPAKTFMHVRGDFLRHGDEVKPGVLAALTPVAAATSTKRLPARAEPNRNLPGSVSTNGPTRLDLAHWLVNPANPLTARVEVNRLWQHLFGRGLVATPNDFGTRGEPPSHPELLDWLAAEFTQRGWSRKAMIRLIVTSAAYRQSSHLRPELVERDPQNNLLARQNRFRVEAELVRDLHLVASGLLNPAVGGPSIRPPMPAELYKIGYVDRSIPWVESTGAERYRRGLYVQTQRTVQHPLSTTLDAANPSETIPLRERSNTPLQALTLLNDAMFFECAQALARRMDAERGPTPRAAIAHGFELCLGRPPSLAEMVRLEKLFDQELLSTAANPGAAATLLGPAAATKENVAKQAALVVVAQTLLNLDEFLTRE